MAKKYDRLDEMLHKPQLAEDDIFPIAKVYYPETKEALRIILPKVEEVETLNTGVYSIVIHLEHGSKLTREGFVQAYVVYPQAWVNMSIVELFGIIRRLEDAWEEQPPWKKLVSFSYEGRFPELLELYHASLPG